MPDEAANNLQTSAPGTPGTEQVQQTGSEAGASTPESSAKQPPTTSTQTGQVDFDVRKSYEELRKEFTRRTQHEKELMSRLSAMEESAKQQAELLAKATEEPYNPDVFMETWKAQGPKALDPYIQKRDAAIRADYDKRLSEIQQKTMQQDITLNLALRRGDEENYPDFHSLEGVMNDIATAESCPVDLTKPIPEVLDALYKLAKEQHSIEAIKQAEKLGAQNKEQELAKEAATAVAGGGKHQGVTSPDFSKMSVSDMRKHLISKIGEAED